MSPTTPLYVAISVGGGLYKHWSLFIDGPTAAQKITLSIIGSSTRYRSEMSKSDPRESADLLELLELCTINTSEINAVKAAAQRVVVQNKFAGYNCQDYVLDLLNVLEEKGIIDKDNEAYEKNKETLRDKEEGFESMA